MGSTDISLGSSGQIGQIGQVFKKGEGCCGIREGTMLLSKKLYHGIYRYISGILRADRADRAGFSKRGRGAAEFDRVLCY